ncbi:hypothetical protein M011DRAFT_494723 [Sporormia fimetaria CBS 119925]|uniref:Uncharacterized protein n=1 Tax=Sporormia fimetaria CBS 119925 TaxID=1340428 RepID=A0A6A6VBH5_9PLEO|nr:hypothetical protein M011DRAFT_494723 [Sporormia fimetaria CBS 119925]
MTASEGPQRLHWTQKIALVRHNLHSARRTGDYTFFKTLQAQVLLDGTDHVALLHSILGDTADSVLSTLDNLNAGIAYVHQDAFKAVYDPAKSTMYKIDNSPSSRRSLIRVDIHQQRDMADLAIDKTTNSATNLIETQPVHCQEAIANAWITGVTIIADAVCVCLNRMKEIEQHLDDFIRLEYSWTCTQTSVDAAISALRGIFNLMAGSGSPGKTARQPVIPSSTSSAMGMIKRALSVSYASSPQQPEPKSRTSSSPFPAANPRGLRLSVSAACPTQMPTFTDQHTLLTSIPHTPTTMEKSGPGDTLGPFQAKDDYFASDLTKDENEGKVTTSSSEDLMHLESLDPLWSPAVDDTVKMSSPATQNASSSTSFGAFDFL